MGRLKVKAGLEEATDEFKEEDEVTFEDLILLRVGYEYSRACKRERTHEFNDMLDEIKPSFDEYQAIFNYLLRNYPLEPVKFIGKDNKEGC